MADSKNSESPPSVPPKEPIKTDQPETRADTKEKNQPQIRTYSEVASSKSDSKREGQDKPCSREKQPVGMLATAPRKKEIDNGVKLTPKDDETNERDAEAGKGVINRDAMELDSPVATTEVFSDSSAYQSPPLQRTALPPTAEEFEPLNDFSGFESTSFNHHNDNKFLEENTTLHRHVQDLHRKLAALNTDRQIAEERAERLADKVDNMKQKISSNMTEVERSSETLATKVEELAEENRALREQLNDAQSHIFSLQPYRKALTPEEVGQEYDTLVEQVQDWVQKFMNPWLEDHNEGVDALLASIKKRGAEANKFKLVLQQYPDLVHGCWFPETDEDILTSLIMRFLHDNVFQTVLYGTAGHYIETISFIENQMQASVEPKRDLFSVRTWTAEAYNAILSSRQFKPVREERRVQMTKELAGMLRIFFDKDKFQWFCENLSSRVVWPAMKLYEKMQISTDHFYTDINPYIVWSGRELSTSTEFIDSIKKLDCKNVLKNRKAFNVERIDPTPSKKELYHHLLNVCTVAPALYMRQIGQRDAIKDPIVVRKQQMLVAWGTEEKRRAYVQSADRTLVSHLHASKYTGEGWAPFWK
ncbi:hypothetical protein ACHAPJ_002886 [Fusarium lateritium]